MKNYVVVFLMCFFVGCSGYESNVSDVKTDHKKIKINKYHDELYADEYDWLRDPNHPYISNSEILKFVEVENNKSNNFFEDNSGLLDDVFNEVIARKAVRSRVPYEDNKYIYTSEYIDKAKYRTHYFTNKKTGVTKLLLDERERAINNKYYKLMSFKISPNGNHIVWIEDVKGHEDGSVYIKNLSRGVITPINIDNVSDNFVWNSDSSSFFYIKKDDKGRDYKIINQSIVGSYKSREIYTDKDENFQVGVKSSVNKDKVFVYSDNWVNSETHEVIEHKNGDMDTALIMSRDLNTYHDVDYIDGIYYSHTNYFNENFDLVELPSRNTPPEKWRKLVDKHEGSFFKDVVFFNDFFAVAERENGMDKLLIVDRKTGKSHYIDFNEDIVGLTLSSKQNIHSDKLRISVASNLTPRVLYLYNTSSRILNVLQDAIIKGYDKTNYAQERLLVPSNDGTKIPVTLIYNKKFGPNIDNPVYMYVYGSYGDGIPPEFPILAMSAIDRGFTYAIAHVRGGDELGKKWHEQGKLLNRKNTFNDFVSISQHLVNIGYVAKGNISITGESAAGTTIGVAINQRPDLFKSVSVLVPFVDVLNTLMDTSLEYTMTDWSEYGNPVESKEIYDYMKSYSPYDNIKKQYYPNIYVTGGLDDPAVGYWEPAKWVSKIRDNQTNKSLTLLSFRDGGHVNSGTHSVQYDFAKQLTFLIVTHNLIINK
jgi:oligopeptidase B